MRAAKKFVVIAASLLTLVSALPGLHADNIPGVFGTGVDNSGIPLPVGSTDLHYTIAASPVGPAAAVVTTVHPAWISNSLYSAWINTSGSATDPAPSGTFEYVLTFSLAGLDPTTAVINGQWSSDNQSSIFLNGVDTGYSDSGTQFASFASFQLNSGFIAGLNELEFMVDNGVNPPEPPNPTGLQVNILSATATAAPEPSTIPLLCLCGLTLAGLRRCCASKL